VSTTTGTPAGWYPQADGQQRYWDGAAWTDNYAPAAATAAAVAPKKPWFKKKRVIIPLLGLAGIIAIASTSGGGSTETQAVQTDAAAPANPAPAAKAPAAKAPAAKAPAAKAAPGIGSKVVDGKFQFTVTKVERIGKTLPVAEFMPAVTAQGEFIVVRINVKNVGNEAQTLSTFMSQKMLTADGKTFDCSTDVTSLKGYNTSDMLKGINPGNAVTNAPILFDVPVGAKITSLELHDSPFSGGVKVAIK
jgi:hypothetical protein